MIDSFLRILVNLLYLVPLVVMRFKKKEPDSQVLLADATKAQKLGSDNPVEYGLDWALSRRGVLILTQSKLVCGSWDIPLSEVEKATLVHIRTYLTHSGVLKVSTIDGQHYQFGLQYSLPWEQQTVLKLSCENIDPKYAAVSVGARLARIVLMILVLAWCAFICFLISMLVLVDSGVLGR